MSPGPGPRKRQIRGCFPTSATDSFLLPLSRRAWKGRETGGLCNFLSGAYKSQVVFFVPTRKQLSTPSLPQSMPHCLWDSGSPWYGLYNPDQTFSTQCFFLKGSKASFLPDISKLNGTRQLPSILPLGYLCDPGQVSKPRELDCGSVPQDSSRGRTVWSSLSLHIL